MLNDMLKEYKTEDYVYIIEGCMNLYVSNKKADDEPCPVCDDYDWDYCEGYVSDIRKAKDLEDLEKIQLLRKQKTYGQKNDDAIITHYLDANLEGGIKQKNLDKILDLIDEYVEVVEIVYKEEQGPVKKLVLNK